MGTGTANAEWHEELRARGYRLTPQRQLVLEAVERLGHATPEEIAGAVRETARAVNISTVYRTLELLEDLGLVTHTHLSHGSPTYHAAREHVHAHLVCRDCGAVETLPAGVAERVAEDLRGTRGFVMDVGHFSVFGSCAACVSRDPEASPAS